MQTSLSDYITTKYKDFAEKPEETLKVISKEKNKDYAKAVKCFQDRINKDRKKEKKPEVTFMQVRMRLIALKEIDDMRTFYKECLRYAGTKDKKTGKRNSFSRMFWGATRVR